MKKWTEFIPGRVKNWGQQQDGSYNNPILQGDFSDPDVIREGDTYYMVVSTMQLSPGITILESRDLVNWQIIGSVLDHLEKLDPQLNWDRMYGYGEGVYAASLRTLQYKGKKRYIVHTTLFKTGIIAAWAEDIHGPWHADFMKDRFGRPLDVPGWDDTCPYFETDAAGGSLGGWLVASKPGGAWYPHIFRLSPDGLTLLDGDRRYMGRPGDNRWSNGRLYTDREGAVVRPVHTAEANKILKFGLDTRIGQTTFTGPDGSEEKVADQIYLFQSECIEVDGVTMRVPMLLRARSIYGDHRDASGHFLKAGTPEDPGAYETMHIFDDYTAFHTEALEPNQGAIVPVYTEDHEDWYFVTHHGMQDYLPWCRPISLVKLTWENGWPKAGKMQWQGAAPFGTPRIPSRPVQEQSETFDEVLLRPDWLWNFVPREGSYELTDGCLRLYSFASLEGRTDSFSLPNALGKRYLYHGNSTVSTRLRLQGMEEGQEAGLMMYNGGRDALRIGVKKTAAGLWSFDSETERTVLLTEAPVTLRFEFTEQGSATGVLEQDGLEKYRTAPFEMHPYGYRGMIVSLYTFNNDSAGYVDFEYYEVK